MQLSRQQMIDFYKDLVARFPIISIEDAFSEEDWELFRKQIQIMIWGGIIDAVVLGETPDDAAENRSQQIVDHIRKYIF